MELREQKEPRKPEVLQVYQATVVVEMVKFLLVNYLLRAEREAARRTESLPA